MKLTFEPHTLPRQLLPFFAAGLFLLSLLSAYYFRVSPSVRNQEQQLERYIHRQEQDLAATLGDSALMQQVVNDAETLDEFRQLEEKGFGLFIYAASAGRPAELKFWNSQKILLPDAMAGRPEGVSFARMENGFFVVHKNYLPPFGPYDSVISYALIPVLNQYYLETNNLATRFVHDGEATKKISIADGETPYAVTALSGETLFHIKRVAHTSFPTTDTLTILLRLSGLIFLLVWFHFLASEVTLRKGAARGILLMAFLLLAVCCLIYFFPGFFSFRQFRLFDPTIYAANILNRSLGALLLNALFFCWLVLFAWFRIGPIRNVPTVFRGWRIYVAAILAVFLLIFTTFQAADIIRSLVADSKISFQVTNFFTLDRFTAVGFIVLALISLSYYCFTRILFRIIFTAFAHNTVYIYFSIAVIGLIYVTFHTGSSVVLFQVPVLVWLVLYTLLVNEERLLINRFRVTATGVLFWIFLFSVSLSAIILQGNQEKELRTRKGIALKYEELTDPASERLLSIAITYLDNRFLLNNFNRFFNRNENRYIRDSIITDNFTGYINKYDTKIYVFDAALRAVNNSDPTTYSEINRIFTSQSRPTGIPDLFYHENAYDQFTYITKRQIRDSTRTLGYFFIISTPRQFNTNDATLSPELFRQVNVNELENSPVYSHAIYRNQNLHLASSKYPFRIKISLDQIPDLEFNVEENGAYNELWYRASSQKVIVIAKKKDSLIESITLFSYLFCSFLLMVALLQLISILIRALSDWRALRSFWQFNIRTQIRGIIIFISVLSFLIIGAATITFFINRYNRNNVDRLSRTAGIMLTEMQRQLSDFRHLDSVGRRTTDTSVLRQTNAARDSLRQLDSALQQRDTAVRLRLERLVEGIADIHDVHANVYDLRGRLVVSSEEEIYEKGILSHLIHPRAFYHLNRLEQVQHVQEERLSTLNYLSMYNIVRNDRGDAYAYLNIPYFSSQLDLNQEISNFLVTIINLNAFIFLLAGVVALFITNRITRSFSLIGEKMRAITLGKTNEEIEWGRDDEIGVLVTQYNRMVRELEKSADALARSEREGAWREMARQVAHEIKNPLTPMKLSIQYLQRAINGNQPNVKELSANVAGTLIEQIDHLSKIAADFSQFANIGNKRIELVDLHQVIHSLVELNRTNEDVTIDWTPLPGSLVMKADKTHMNRLFTNLLTNAVEACPEGRACHIRIHEELHERRVVIVITDNGEGIPPDMHARIFVPNFTTKTSGTGLGLAMSKSIVEQADGNIWFETETGVGTTFYVELPVIT